MTEQELLKVSAWANEELAKWIEKNPRSTPCVNEYPDSLWSLERSIVRVLRALKKL